MEHIGIDVHKNQSQICILTIDGELIEKRIVTEDRRFAGVFGSRPRTRILIEAREYRFESCLRHQRRLPHHNAGL